jgi:hypothetical protein
MDQDREVLVGSIIAKIKDEGEHNQACFNLLDQRE